MQYIRPHRATKHNKERTRRARNVRSYRYIIYILSQLVLGPREFHRVADIGHAGKVHHHALEPQPESTVRYAAEPTQIEVVLIVGELHAARLYFAEEFVVIVFALRAADDLAHAGHEQIGRGYGLAVGVLLHVERFYLARIVYDEHGFFVVLVGEVAFMLRLEIESPFDGVDELLARLFENIYRLGIIDARKVAVNDVFELGDKPVLEPRVEEFELGLAVLDRKSTRLNSSHR